MIDPLITFYKEMQTAYNLSTTKMNKAIAAAYGKLADAATPIPVPPIPEPPIPPTPTTGWPKDKNANPTGPKKPLTINNGDWNSTSDGQTLDASDITGYIRIHHNNVTVSNFRTKGVIQDPGKKGAKLSDGQILSDGSTDGYQWNEAAFSRTEFTNTFDGAKAHGNISFDQCWFHDNLFRTGAGTGAGDYTHNDAIQVSSGNNITFTKCRVENWHGNAGVFVDPDQGTISNVTISGNYFTNVGNYPIYIKESASNPGTGLPTTVIVKDNIIGARRSDTPANWGPMLCEIRANQLTFANNVEEASGKTIKLDGAGKGYV